MANRSGASAASRIRVGDDLAVETEHGTERLGCQRFIRRSWQHGAGRLTIAMTWSANRAAMS